ncbi:hypothetical protein C2E23DRAFT_447488 [Lenzites betulinus]|nr:hypothetical protein C2E23DRAFT_447488 [Lenzites betulinus]
MTRTSPLHSITRRPCYFAPTNIHQESCEQYKATPHTKIIFASVLHFLGLPPAVFFISSNNKSTRGSTTRNPIQGTPTSTTTPRGIPTSTATRGTPTSNTTRGAHTSTALATRGARTSTTTRSVPTSASASVPMPTITNSGSPTPTPGPSNPTHGANTYNQGSQTVFPRWQGRSAANTNRRQSDVINPTTVLPSSPTSSPSPTSSAATPLASDFPLPRPRLWSDITGVNSRPQANEMRTNSDPTNHTKRSVRRTFRGL